MKNSDDGNPRETLSSEGAFYDIIVEKYDMLEGSFVSYESMKLDAGLSVQFTWVKSQ